MQEKTYKFTETFFSPQGEGFYTGAASAWIRFFQCNLECPGFGQDDPTDPSTYILPYKDFDLIDIKTVEELPVWDRGCDSSYSWSKKYRHLAKDKTASEICDEIEDQMKNAHNPHGLFRHPKSGQDIHFCITGGEPMMNQAGIVAIMEEFENRHNAPKFITIETNGTQKMRPNFRAYFSQYLDDGDCELFWSISPKLFNTSGELKSKAYKKDVVGDYAKLSSKGQLKYVVNGTDASWKELEERTTSYRFEHCDFDVWVMPVGATVESQELTAGDMAVEIIKRGYKVAARVHVYLFGNQVGT